MRKEIKKRGQGGAIAINKEELRTNDLKVKEVVDVEIRKISNNKSIKEVENVRKEKKERGGI